jgi:putative copper resistance protein D
MEHSALHGAQLIGALLALAAPLLALLILAPARAAISGADAARLADQLETSLARWAFRGAAIGAVATFSNLVVQVAEIEGTTLLAGADLSLLWRFATATEVGRLTVLRGVLLAAAAVPAAALAATPRPRQRSALWVLVAGLAVAALAALSLVSHAAAQPAGRAAYIALQLAHLAAAGAWIGALMHLLAARSLLVRARSPGEVALVAEVIRRFSPVAFGAACVLGGSGLTAAWLNLGRPLALFTSAYGLTLGVKLLLLATLLVPAYVNARLVRPALLRCAADGDRSPDAAPTLARLARMLEFEVTAGVLVVAVAGILGSVSPPSPDGVGSLSAAQAATVLTPHLPQTQVVDPSSWVGSATRTDDDLRYSEFMHNWSGLIVCLLGAAWLAQALGGRFGDTVGRYWPLALIPFAIFVAIASDPEVWPMGNVSPLAALRDPIVLEHRIGALMIVVLAWLGLREERRGGADRPLGRALPILMIVGSLLLLGHAHSSFGATETLTTLINVQHAVLGGLGLLAGVVRWLELRGLFPRRVARALWPTLVIAVGAFMAFSYRELL